MLYLFLGILFLLYKARAYRTLWFIGVSAITSGLWVFGWCFAALMCWIFNPEPWRQIVLLSSLTAQHMDAATSPAGCIGAVIFFPVDILRWTFDITFNQAMRLGIIPLPLLTIPITVLIAWVWWKWIEFALSDSIYNPNKPLVNDLDKAPVRRLMKYDERGPYYE